MKKQTIALVKEMDFDTCLNFSNKEVNRFCNYIDRRFDKITSGSLTPKDIVDDMLLVTCYNTTKPRKSIMVSTMCRWLEKGNKKWELS